MGEMKDAGSSRCRRRASVPTAAMMRRRDGIRARIRFADHRSFEDKSLARGGVCTKDMSLVLGLRGVPATAEEVDALRDCALAELAALASTWRIFRRAARLRRCGGQEKEDCRHL